MGTDASIIEVDGEEAILFPVRTAKRGGKIRPILLPLQYDPWARALAGWFEHKGEGRAFPMCMRSLQRFASGVFEGLSYPIEKYYKPNKVEVPAHWKDMCTHALRHIRALQDLMCFYGFDGLDLAIPKIASRYLHLIGNDTNKKLLTSLAKKYFPKLCKVQNWS
jgi:hypothetical protein